MTQYTQGRAFEYRVRDALRADGYEVIRSAGSKGIADLIAFKGEQMLFVQAKRRNGTCTPAERSQLLNITNYGVRALPLVAYQPALRKPIAYRRLTGLGAQDWQPWTPDQVGTP